MTTSGAATPRERLERRFASVTYGYRYLSLEGALRRIAANGFQAVEIVGTRPHMLPEDYPGDELAAVASLLSELELRVVAIAPFSAGSHWHFTAARARVRAATIDHVKRCVDVAASLGCPVVQSITGAPIIQDVPPREAWRHARDGLRACAEYAEAHGVRIALEGEDDTLVRSSADILEMIADIGHANMVRGDDPVRAAQVLAPHMIHIHAHDNDGWRDDHAPLGSGTVDWAQLARELASYQGAITIEVGSRNPDGVAAGGRAFFAEHLLPHLPDDEALHG